MLVSKIVAIGTCLGAIGLATLGCSSSSSSAGTATPATHATTTTSAAGGSGGQAQGGAGGAGGTSASGGAGGSASGGAGGSASGGAGGTSAGGAGGAGGSGGGGAVCGEGFSVCDPVFAAFKACGGDPTGSWTYVDFCQKPKLGKVDPKCPNGVQEGGAIGGQGTLDFDGQGTATLEKGAVFQGLYHMAAPVSCIAPLDCHTYQQALAQQLPGACCAQTNDVCDCLAPVTNSPSDVQTEAYKVTDKTLTLGTKDFQFCVDGSDLWLWWPGDADNTEVVEHLKKK
jgi:hypothetical protein